jgi:hypothetical protein
MQGQSKRPIIAKLTTVGLAKLLLSIDPPYPPERTPQIYLRLTYREFETEKDGQQFNPIGNLKPNLRQLLGFQLQILSMQAKQAIRLTRSAK